MTGLAVYEPSSIGEYEGCHPVNDDYFIKLTDLIDGTPRLATWTPIQMTLVREDRGKKLLPSDAPWYGDNALIFRPSIVLAIGKYLQEYGELLPLTCKDAKLVMYNPTRVLDALDEDASVIDRFDDGRIMMIDHHVFRDEVICGVDVFKLPLRGSATFVSQRFVDRWHSHKFVGLDFVPVK